MPEETEKIRQSTELEPQKENRDLLAESFARSSWIRVFSPIDSTQLIDDAWRNKLNNIRKKHPLFGQDNRYFEPYGDKRLIKEWNDFEADMHIDNPLGGYDTVLLQSGLMYRDNFGDPEEFHGGKNKDEWKNRNRMVTGFMGVYGRGNEPGDPIDPVYKKDDTPTYKAGPNTPHGASPIPGVKNVTIAYKGGVKAIKEATI